MLRMWCDMLCNTERLTVCVRLTWGALGSPIRSIRRQCGLYSEALLRYTMRDYGSDCLPIMFPSQIALRATECRWVHKAKGRELRTCIFLL